MKLSIVGLGKLGLPFAVAFASRGFDVVGIDTNADAVARVMANAPNPEPRVNELLGAALEAGTFRATTDYSAITDTDATFVIVPTPSLPDGAFSTEYVEAAMREVAASVLPISHLVVLMSTVMPGDCESRILPILHGRDSRINFAYSPEFIALGSVVSDFLHPDMMVIGANDEHAALQLEDIYRRLLVEDYVPISHMSIVEAELTKIALNNALCDRIDFANTLAEICERIPGANVDTITQALGKDSRIGPKYLRGGLGFGGPCFPRDVRAMAALMESLELDPARPLGVAERNDAVVERVVGMVGRWIDPDAMIWKCDSKAVCVYGVSYKTGTPVLEESQGYMLYKRLRADGHRDPLVQLYKDWGPRFVRGDEPRLPTTHIIALPYPEFANIDVEPGDTIIDCWRIIDPATLPDGVTYKALGIGAAEE